MQDKIAVVQDKVRTIRVTGRTRSTFSFRASRPSVVQDKVPVMKGKLAVVQDKVAVG